MGELYRQRQEAIKCGLWRDKPITDAQKDTLRRICEKQDGAVDETWLNGLTAGEASDEITRRTGEADG